MKKHPSSRPPQEARSLDREILSVTPAFPGWRAVMIDPPSESAVLAWALVKQTLVDNDGLFTLTDLTPVIADNGERGGFGTTLACLAANFVGVAAPDQDADLVRAAGREDLIDDEEEDREESSTS